MTLGPLMVDLAGYELSREEKEVLQHPLVGGVVLFTRNFRDTNQLMALTRAIHEIRSPRLLIAVDHEGGRVQRFREEFTRLPAVSRLGELYNRDVKKSLQYARITGWLMASELLATGIDISFAPVLDLDHGISSVIGDRSFHRKPEIVANIAHAYMSGMREAGMMATGKHFPGHGAVQADSHIDLPVDSRRYEDIASEDMLAFERMIHYGMAAVMMAHVIYSKVDRNPAGFSRQWISQVLRKKLEFQGVVFSDDLSMKAAECMGSYADRARLSLEAGCDMVLVCNSNEGRNQVLDQLKVPDNPASALRLVRLHGKFSRTWEELHALPEWKQAVDTVIGYDPEPLLDMDMD